MVINYSWEQFKEEDPVGGLACILVYSFITLMGLLAYVMITETE